MKKNKITTENYVAVKDVLAIFQDGIENCIATLYRDYSFLTIEKKEPYRTVNKPSVK